MKTRRAKTHLDALEKEIMRWIKSHPYSITEEDDSEAVWHYFIIKTRPITEDVPLIAGDFINCLRSALDQLAWNLVNLFPETVPKDEKTARRIDFPICDSDASYLSKRGLFPPAIALILDSLQPNDRANAFRFHPLWQLNKLWNIDKHRTIPINCGSFGISARGGMNGYGLVDYLHDRIVMRVPSLARVSLRPMYIQPRITPQVTFGEFMSEGFELPVTRLGEIYKYVIGDVITKFTGFFP
jgi:hypothetical protein